MVSTVANSNERQTGLKLPADLYRRVRVAAAERDQSIKAFITAVLTQHLDRQNKRAV